MPSTIGSLAAAVSTRRLWRWRTVSSSSPTAYCLLRDRQPSQDLGATYLDERDAARTERYHIHRLEQLGFTVALSPAA